MKVKLAYIFIIGSYIGLLCARPFVAIGVAFFAGLACAFGILLEHWTDPRK